MLVMRPAPCGGAARVVARLPSYGLVLRGRREPSRGFTLVEFMVAITVLSILLTLGVPAFSEFLATRRMQAAADVLYAQALFARSEAIKRNVTTVLQVNGGDVEVRQDDASLTVLRATRLPQGIALAPADVRFGANGRTRPLGATLFLSPAPTAGCTASDTLVCPQVAIGAGGEIQVCRDGTCS